MNFDALTLAAVADQLRRAIVGGRVQRVVHPSATSIALELYHAGSRHQVFASADPRSARAHLLGAKPTSGVDRPTPLSLLLRKYVRNGFVHSIEQPDLERVLVLSIVKHPPPRKEDADGDDVTEELRCELILELVGQRANIILVDDDNLILDAVKRVPADGSRRVIMPREPYIMPPRPQNRRDPRAVTPNGIAVLLEGEERDLARAIIGAYNGVSPQLAREVIARATGQPQAILDPSLPFDAIADALRTLWTAPFEPSLAWENDTPIAFAPYRMAQYPDVRPVETISHALETFYAASDRITAHAQRRDALRQRLLDARDRVQRQRDALGRELERANALERLRWEGEMIFGYMHAIEPGQRTLEVEGQAIKLDPNQTPVENAQRRFRDYDKAKGALAGVPERVAATDAQLAYLDETLALLDLADGYDAIGAIEREVEEQGVIKSSGGRGKARGPRSAPLRLRSSDGLTIVVGRSAGQNEETTWKIARSDDPWLHVRDMPGAHVVVLAEGDVPDQTILEAAGLAAYFSGARGSTSADVILTLRRHLRKIPGGAPGLVSFRHERALRVAPLSPAELQTHHAPDQMS